MCIQYKRIKTIKRTKNRFQWRYSNAYWMQSFEVNNLLASLKNRQRECKNDWYWKNKGIHLINLKEEWGRGDRLTSWKTIEIPFFQILGAPVIFERKQQNFFAFVNSLYNVHSVRPNAGERTVWCWNKTWYFSFLFYSFHFIICSKTQSHFCVF